MRFYPTLAAVLATTLVPSAAQAYTPQVAVQDEAALTCGTPEQRSEALTASKWLGAKVVRLNAIQTSPWDGKPGCDIAPAIKDVRAKGMRPQVTVVGSLAYTRKLVRRHARQVKTWSVWNEPNHPGWWFGPVTSKPASYGRHYQRSYKAIRKADREACVLFGELVDGSGAYLRKAVRGRRLRACGIAIHPYEWSSDPRKQFRSQLVDYRRLARTLARKGLLCRTKPARRCRPVPIYVTEFGYLSVRRKNWAPIADTIQAKWLPRAWKVACQQGVRQMLHYQLYESASDLLWDTSLFADDGGARPQAVALARYLHNTKRCNRRGNKLSPAPNGREPARPSPSASFSANAAVGANY